MAAPEQQFPAHVDIVKEGVAPQSVFLIKEGMAVAYRCLADGTRQIMAFFIAGDLCNGPVGTASPVDHSIEAITPVLVAPIPHEHMMETLANHPRISSAHCFSVRQEQAMLRERLVSLGRRDARGRVAHLLCELYWRHAAVGMMGKQGFRLALTQMDIADALGLTAVSINRVMQDFRRNSLVSTGNRMICLLSVPELQEIAELSEDYLLLNRTPKVSQRLQNGPTTISIRPEG
jgi:CRP-like cAMP-binding protein